MGASTFEPLEARMMLDAGAGSQAPTIVVGRTLSIYDAPHVTNHQETITLTVYNQAADPLSGVLLTDTLASGVTLAGASQQPDQNGQQLAWSLGTIQPYDRASVTLTVTLDDPIPTQLDTGASAFGTLDAGMVSWTTAPATLRSTAIAPALLASTPDANTTDPFVQEAAAELKYDPQRIFDFLHDDITYNSYAGSVRGARGTLWSHAGNSLDTASLGVALLRASGVPAQYVAGTLSQAESQQLIASMFSPSNQTIGFVADGAVTSDPANDSRLLNETQNHYWFQYDTGAGMQDADPLMPGALPGQSFTSAAGAFSEVPDNLREKTQVQLVAEITNAASALFGLGGQQDTTVIDQTFNDVELVGRPLSLAFNVSSNSGGFIYTTTTNVYSPYLAWGDDAYDSKHDQIFDGASFQETLTNFPFGSQALTGLFLNVTESGPQGASQTFSRTLFDRIGYAARQGLVAATVSTPAGGAPVLTNFDIYTLDVSAAAPDPHPTAALNQELQANVQQLAAMTDTTSNAVAAQPYARSASIDLTRGLGNNFLTLSTLHTTTLASESDVAAYFDRPRVVMISQQLKQGASSTPAGLNTAIDILNDAMHIEGAPGQSVAAPVLFNATRGMFDNMTERDVIASLAPGQTPQVDNTFDIFQAAAAQGIGLTTITSANLNALDSLDLPADAKARITVDVNQGFGVIVPVQSVLLGGQPTIAWAEINLTTGEYIGVDANGGHQGSWEFLALIGESLDQQLTVIKFFSPVAGIDAGAFLGVAYQLSAAVGDEKEAAAALKEQKDKVEELYKQLIENGELASQLLKEGIVATIIAKLQKAVEPDIEGLVRKTLGIADNVFNAALDATVFRLTGHDPQVTGILSNPQPLAALPANQATASASLPSQPIAGAVQGTGQVASISLSQQIDASWSSDSTSQFQASSLSAANATIFSAGQPIGSGAVSLSGADVLPVAISGANQFQVSGTGSLSFYGPAESSLGVSGDWSSYTANVSGNVTLTLTTSGLMLNGAPLPAGTYTITTNSAALAGSGRSSSPNFAGTAAINSTGATIHVGPSTGNITVGGQSLAANGGTLTGYQGSIAVASNGNGTDSVTFSGNTANVLAVAPNPPSLNADQNTPVSFNANVQTSFADTYALTVEAPIGWTASIDGGGNVTVQPAPGTQSGAFPIRVIAKSTTNAELVAQGTAIVTVAATQPSVSLGIVADPLLTVPYGGAQLPTAFQAQITNTGPNADTFNLAFSNVASGFAITSSRSSVTIPAGQTAVVGIYLQPTGSLLPPPNSDASFTLTATSASNGSVQATQTQTFAMPAVDAVKVSAVPAQLSSTPGAAATTAITLVNVGNVSETVTLSASGPADVVVDGLSSATLAPGETKTVAVTLTPAATAALNSTFLTTITAAFGPAGNPQSASALVSLLVRSAQTVAISQASIDATSAGNSQLGGTLASLGDAVSRLQESPADANLLSRVQLLLNNLAAELAVDPALAALVAQLAPLQTDANSGDVAGLLAALPAFFQNVDAVLAVEAHEQFTISISPNGVDLPALANQQKTLSVQITNTGPAPETLDLSTGALPNGVTADLAQAQITLQPGETQTVNLTLTSNLVSTKVFTLDVHAAATATQHDATAVVAVRAAAADVLGVTVSPVAVNAGDTLSVSASVFNTANASRSVLAHITVLDATNQVIASAPDVPLFLSPTAAAVTFDLGAFGTAGLANGVYSLLVSLRASDGSSLPGKTARVPFVVGLPISATVSANPTTLPPGDSNVTTTITVSNQNPGNFTPLIVQQPSGGGSPTNQTQSSGNNAPPSNAPAGANPMNFAPSGFPPLNNATPNFTPPAPPSPPEFNPPAGDNLIWIGPASGDWNVAANWFDTTTSTNHVPNATDNVTIDAAGLTITIASGAQAAQSLWVKAGSLIVNNGSLKVSAGTEIDDTLVLNANGSLFAGGGLVNKGDVQWTSGALNLGGANAFNLGVMTLAGGVVLSSTNGANTSNLGGQFINEGTVVDQASFVTLRDSIVLNNTSLGIWEFAADTVINSGSFTPAVINSGTFRKTGGSGNSDIQLPMTSTDGVFEAQTGTLRLANSADAFFDGAFNAAAGATVYLNSGSDGMSFSGTFAGSGAGAVLLQSGAIYLDSDATFDFAPGLFQWNNATIDLQGHTLTNAGSLALGLVNQGTNEHLTSRVSAQTGLGGALNNLGTIVEQGATNFHLYDNVALNNPAQGSLIFAGDGNVLVGGQAPSFVTEGTIEKTSGPGLSQIAVTTDYLGGPVMVDSGTLAFDGPDGQFASANFTVAAGAVLDLAHNSDGNVLSGTFTGSGGGTVLLGSGSIVVGAAGATFDFPAGMFQWTGGGINLDGHTLVNSGSISLAASGNVSLFANSSFTGANNANLGGTLVNAGEMIQQNAGNLYLYDSVSLTNQAGANYQFAGDSDIVLGNFSPTATNAGTIEKTSGTAVSSIGVPFSNLGGTLVVDSGTLALAGRGGASTGASIQVAAGAVLDLSGNTDGNIYSGTYTGAGAGNVLLQNGDFIVGAGGATFNFPAGMFQWTGGGINLFGHTLTNAGFITIANPANVALYGNGNFVGGPNTGDNKGGTLDNQGTIADQGPAAVYLYDSVLLKNEAGAAVSLTGGASLVYQNYSSAISNAGTIEVDSGALKSTISAPLTNSGAVDVVGGELDLTGAVTNSGALDARANTLKFIGAVQNTGVIKTENGVLNFSEPNSQSFAVSNLGVIQVDGGSASFTGPITQVNSGYLTGGEWAARGGGTITLPAGSNVKFNEAKIVLDGAGSSIGGLEPLATNDGVFSITAGAGFTTAGDFTNNGTLELGPGGMLSVAGDYAQAATAELDVQLAGAPASGNFGQLAVAGAAAFGGLLRSEFVNGYLPAPGDDFTAATYASTSGAFSAAALAETPSVAYTADLGATSLVLASQAASLAPTQTTVASSAPAGANYGQLVQYTATVSAASGTPTGAVQFQIDGVLQGAPAPLVGGQAALTLSLPAGTHTIVAFYLAGGAAFANSDNAGAPLIQIVKATSAPPVSVELYYTTFSPGTVEKVSVTFDQSGLSLGAPTSIVRNIAADGLIFLPNGDLLTANGTASEINPFTGAVTSVNAFGGEHLALDPSGTKVWTSPQPGALVELPINPLADGIVHALSGDDTQVTHLAFDSSGQAYYVSSGPGGFGSFGLIDLTTFTTRRIYANLPAAHGISYDPFTGDLFLVGADSIVQIDPRTLKIVSQRDFPNLPSVFDQGANDGKGHIYVANNAGYLAFVDYSATGLVGDASNFVATPFLVNALDDVAPLSGLGASGIPVSIDHHLPPGGYSVNPSSITPASASFSNTDVVWQTTFAPGQAESDHFQLTGQATNMAPGEVRQISDGTTISATITAPDGSKIPVSIDLPPVVVAAQHIIELAPPSVTVDQGASAAYTVELSNPLSTDEVYTLSVDGLPAGETAHLAATVVVPAGQTVNVPLSIDVPLGALQGTQAFLVSAQTAAGAFDSVEGQLVVTPQAAVSSLAVHLSLAPTQAVAGQSNPAHYTLTIVNTGDTTDTYALAGDFPAGFAGVFSQTTITVPPGLGNFRQVQLTLTPPAGAAAQDHPFTVTAVSTTDGDVQSQAAGTATVAAAGVQVELTPSSAVPGSTYQLKVTNTGQTADTFNLSLASPGALVSTLGADQVTLGPGASQTVPITTGSVNFALAGALPLTGIAVSQANSAVQDQATAQMTIASTQSMTATFVPVEQDLAQPGATSFLLEVDNTGNTEDTYSATIIGTNGPVAANLIGIEGQPAQSVPIFRVPGLSKGAILLQVNATGVGQGAVTVLVQSLTNGAIQAAPIATVVVASSNAALTLANNSGLAVAEGSSAAITGEMLRTTDSDTSVTPANIVYTLVSAPTQGSLSLDGQQLAVGQTFTQDDLDHGLLVYKAVEEGADSFGFSVSAGDAAPISGTFLIASSDPAVVATGGLTVSAIEGSLSSVQTVATFTDPGGFEPQASYSADIDWGDGSTSAGVIVLPTNGATATVSGQHAYAEEGGYTIRVTLHHESAPDATALSAATVSDPPVAASGGFTYTSVEGGPASLQTLAVFTDPGGAEPLADYSASIDWGDGASATAGVISFDANSRIFTVKGQHVYAADGAYQIRVTLHHDAAPAVTVTGAAQIANASTSGATGIQAAALALAGYERSALSGVSVATFTNGDGSLPAADFEATIDWGDGETSSGSVTFSGGTYTVAGSHTYFEEGAFTLHVEIEQTAGPVSGGATAASVSSTATIHEELLAEGTVGTPNQKYIQEIYRDLFERQAEPQGREFWVAELTHGISRTQLAHQIVQLAFPQEFQRDAVDRLYQQYLGRAPDAAGKQFWTDYLYGGGTIESMSRALVSSSEYFQVRGGGTNAGFLSALFQDALGRQIDATAMAYFEGQMSKGMSVSDIAGVLFSSNEYHRVRVDALFEQFMDRAADENALEYYALQLDRGARDEEIIAQLISSDEYFNHVQI